MTTTTVTTTATVEPIVKCEEPTNISATTAATTTTTAAAAAVEAEVTTENSSCSVIATPQDAESHSEATPTLASVASTSVSTKDSDAVFEIPQSIRFPVNRNNLEVVVCKWASCGLEFDSNGKLLDHLKVNGSAKFIIIYALSHNREPIF